MDNFDKVKEGFDSELRLLIASRCSIIYVPTIEEERMEEEIERIGKEIGYSVFFWDFVDGYKTLGNKAKANPMQALDEVTVISKEQSALFVLRDFHDFIQDAAIKRKMRNLTKLLRGMQRNIILVSPILKIPQELTDDIYILDFLYPSFEEIDGALSKMLGDKMPEKGIKETLIKACLGLTMTRIRSIILKTVARYKCVDERAIPMVLAEKKQYIRQKEVLEFFPAIENIGDIGGLDELKDWLRKRGSAFTEVAKKYGLPNPKGVLLLGIPGTGKSLSVKVLGNLWGMPLLRLDVGGLFGSLVGESEARIRDAIHLAEAMSPCILWIDELDKAFAGIGSGFTGDSGVSARIFGTLITWMQEKTSPVFVAATANNKDVLPPELLRKGRFDEIFFVDLPNTEERKEIFKVHIKKRGREDRIKEFDIDRLSAVSEGFNGAEIEQAIIDAMYCGFEQGREFTTEDIKEGINKTKPLSITKKEEIDELSKWAAQGNARLSSKGKGAKPESLKPMDEIIKEVSKGV